MKRKRVFLLVSVLGLFFTTMTDSGYSESSKPGSGGGMFAALMNPLGLFSERSPGGRGAGALMSTKPDRKSASADTGPHERVLSETRDREPAADLLPAADTMPAADASPASGNPIFDGAPETSPSDGFFPGGGGFPDDQFGGGPGFAGPGGFSNGLPPPDDLEPIEGAPPSSSPPATLPPAQPPSGGGPGSGPITGVPPISAIPEPEIWAMMILGFLAVGLALRRRRHASVS